MESLEAILQTVIDAPFVPNPYAKDFFAKDLNRALRREYSEGRKQKLQLDIFERKLQAAYAFQMQERYYPAGHSFERASNIAGEAGDYKIALKLLRLAEINFGRAWAKKELAHVHLKMAINCNRLGQTEEAQDWYEIADTEFEGFDDIPTKLYAIADREIPKR